MKTTIVSPLTGRAYMTEREMLTVCLEWLDNIRSQDRERYLSAMPNCVPGTDMMRSHLTFLDAHNDD